MLKTRFYRKITKTFINGSSLNSELITTTLVILELISVRDGAFCMPEFDSMSVRQLTECICTN